MILQAFNASLSFAQTELRFAAALVDMPRLQRSCYANASDHLRDALANANAMRDGKRKGAMLKALHWTRLADRRLDATLAALRS